MVEHSCWVDDQVFLVQTLKHPHININLKGICDGFSKVVGKNSPNRLGSNLQSFYFDFPIPFYCREKNLNLNQSNWEFERSLYQKVCRVIFHHRRPPKQISREETSKVNWARCFESYAKRWAYLITLQTLPHLIQTRNYQKRVSNQVSQVG